MPTGLPISRRAHQNLCITDIRDSVQQQVGELREDIMSRLVWLFAVVAVPIASMVHAAESFFVSCDGSPKEARLELPAPANEWGKVGCSQFGHILMAQNGWFWGQDPTPKPAFLPADILNTMQMRKVGNNVYFKEFKIRQLTGSEALKRHELFHKWVGKERTSIYPEVWELLAVNESEEVSNTECIQTSFRGRLGHCLRAGMRQNEAVRHSSSKEMSSLTIAWRRTRLAARRSSERWADKRYVH